MTVDPTAVPDPVAGLVGGRPIYRYYVAWTISGDLALELSFTGVSWSRKIRKAGTFAGSVSFESNKRLEEAYKGTMPGLMSLYVTRNNKPVWGGFIASRNYDPVAKQITVNAVGFEGYLYRRTMWHDVVEANTLDQYQVVRNLIGLMQTDFAGLATEYDRALPHPDNANIGIVVDSRNSGKTQDVQSWSGFEMHDFGSAIEGFSNNLNGFEYNIEVGWNLATDKFTKKLVFRDTPPSQLPVGIEYTGERPGIDSNFFEFPGNILSIGYDDNVDDAGTRVWVTGLRPDPIGDEELPTPRGVYENEPYFSTQWPIFELIESSDHANVSEQATLDKYSRSYGTRVKPPVPAWTVTVNGSMNPQVGSYGPGDWCRMVVSDPFLMQNIESDGETAKVLTKRIAEYSVSVPDTEQVPETVTLTLIDEWNNSGGA